LSIAPIHRDTRGENPMIPPHLLARILHKLNKQRAAIREESAAENDAWAGIDKLSEAMEAAK